ncbi:hypothetical protein [Streptomyces sp. NPDC059874]|uniref:hypothetical protein n=1 Tax=Streptomyces sp. NPDC059874 TaxID=3346983 RepID=UPI00364B9068
MRGRVRHRPLATPVIGLGLALGLFTTACGPLSGTDDAKNTSTDSSPSPSPVPKPLDAKALLAATLSAQEVNMVDAPPAEERRPDPVKELSDPECRQFLALKDGASAPVVVTQAFQWKRGVWAGTTLAAYGNVTDALNAFAKLRTTRAGCQSFSEAGTPDAPVVTFVDRTSPAQGDEALAFALATDVPGQRDATTEEHVVARVGTVIVDFRRLSSDGKGIGEFPTSLMARQVTHLVLAQRG